MRHNRGHAACGMTTVHHPDPIGLTVLDFDLAQELFERRLIGAITGQHFVGQRKTFRGDNQGNDHLQAIGSLIATVAVATLVFFASLRIGIGLKIGACQIVEQHFEFESEQILPPWLRWLKSASLCPTKRSKQRYRVSLAATLSCSPSRSPMALWWYQCRCNRHS